MIEHLPGGVASAKLCCGVEERDAGRQVTVPGQPVVRMGHVAFAEAAAAVVRRQKSPVVKAALDIPGEPLEGPGRMISPERHNQHLHLRIHQMGLPQVHSEHCKHLRMAGMQFDARYLHILR